MKSDNVQAFIYCSMQDANIDSVSNILSRSGDLDTQSQVELVEYQRRNSDLRRAMRDLTLKLAAREKQFSEAMYEGNINESTIRQFLAALRDTEEKDSRIRDLEQSLEEANQTIGELMTRNNQSGGAEEKLRAHITSLNSKIAVLEAREPSSPAASRVTALKLENSKLKQECATQEANNAELVVKILTLQSALGDRANDENRADSTTSRLREQVREISDELRTANATIANFRERETKASTEREGQSHSLRGIAMSAQSRAVGFHGELEKLTEAVSIDTQAMRRKIDGLERVIAQSKQHNNIAITQITELCAKFAGMDVQNIPHPEDISSDPATLEFFLSRASTAFDMKSAEQRASMRKLETAARGVKSQATHMFSPAVERVVQGLQGKVAELSRTLHEDHKQLIDALTAPDDFDE